MYLAVTIRPNIVYAVGMLARFNTNSGAAHWKAAKHLCRYLQETKDYKITYAPNPSSSELFTIYCDADHSKNQDNKRSTSKIVVKMRTGTISWASKLQPFVMLEI